MTTTRKGLFLALLSLLLTTACAQKKVAPPVGIPARIQTRCAIQTQQTLAPATGVFACRGGLLQTDGSLIAGVKGGKDATYTLYSLGQDGAVLAQRTTLHEGPKLILTPTPTGFIAASGLGKIVHITAHDPALGGFTPLAIELPRGQLGSLAAAPIKDGVVVAASTGFGVRAWKVDHEGRVLVEVDILTHPEMPFCRDLWLEPTLDGVKATLQCRDAVPITPAIKNGRATLPDFDYDAPPTPLTHIRVSLDTELNALTATATPFDGTHLTPPRYDTRRLLTEHQPRPKGHRAHILDGVHLGGDDRRILSLACLGPDEGPIGITLAILQCQ